MDVLEHRKHEAIQLTFKQVRIELKYFRDIDLPKIKHEGEGKRILVQHAGV